MTIDAASGVTRPRRPPPWNDPRIRSIFYQILFVAVIAALGAFLIHNTLVNLRRQNIASGFGFLDREAAFGIGESLIAYSPADTYARAFLVGLVNTLWPLILPAWFGYPFFIFLLRQFFMSIPRELDDAARIDGASTFRIFTSVIMPLSTPALATVAIFAFIGNWSNLLDPLIYIRSQELYTLALGLNLFRGVNFTQFNLLMAVSIIQLLPVLIIFFLAQKLFVQGVTLTGMGGK